MPDPERHQNGAPQRTGTGPARQHDAIEHERLVVVGERACMEGCHRRIQGLGDAAYGRGRDRAAQQGQQDLAHLAGTEAEHEAGQDDAVDLGRASCMLFSTPVGQKRRVRGTRSSMSPSSLSRLRG